MQWKCLPIPRDRHGQPAIHYTTVYKVFAKWVDDGSLWQAFIAMVTGPTPWPKKGGWRRLLGVQTPEGGESHRQQWLCVGSCPRGSRECHGYGAPALDPESFETNGQAGWVSLG